MINYDFSLLLGKKIPICGITQLFRIMKLITLLILVTCLHLCAETRSQTISLKVKNQPIKKVFEAIENQTNLTVVYYDSFVDPSTPVSINANKRPLTNVLKSLLDPSSLTYHITENTIVITEAPRKDNKTSQRVKIQQRAVKGRVTDGKDNGLEGATVRAKSATAVAITASDGSYEIILSDQEEMLVFSSLGFETQEIAIGSDNVVNVVMHELFSDLEEVVVVGYGTMKKSDLTGAISTINGNAIANRNTTQLSTALQGATSGLMVTRSNSAPGANADIRIRGITTIGNSTPLIIVDGVPGDINQVHPKDIESISVLKDAASASIYGARAAAGVILITTKRGEASKLSLSYDFTYGIEKPTTQPKNVGVQRYLEMTNELRFNDNPQGGMFQHYSEEQVNYWVADNPIDPDNYPITDWNSLLLRSYAPRKSHILTLSGGTDKVKTRASLSFDETDGLLKVNNIKNDRFLLSVNNDFSFNKYLSASLDVNARRTESHEPSQGDIWYMLRAYPATYAWRWSHGGLADVKGGNNPYPRIKDGGSEEGWRTKLGGRLALNFTPIDGLKFSAVAAPNYSITKAKRFNKKVGYTGIDDPNLIVGYYQDHTTTSLLESRNDNNDITTQFLGNYDKKFGKHTINLMVGYENYYYYNENLSTSRDQYELTEFPYLNIGPKNLLDNSGGAYENAYRSYFGRIMYNYDNRYLIQANYRRDASSRFHPDHQWGGFPSVSAGWVISEENFMKGVDDKHLSFLKFRASYGSLGNERIGNYPYQALMDFTSTLFYDSPSATTPTFYNGAAQIQYAINDISWETTQSYNIGLDAAFLNSRLSLTADYYRKETRDMLLNIQIPAFVGYENPEQNTGKMFTKGFDVEAGWNDAVGDFRYRVSLNLSDFVSKMGDLGGTQFIGSKVKMMGSEFDEWYGYLSDGLFLTQEDVDNSPTINSNVRVGDVKFLDVSGPDGAPDGEISPEYDRVLLGGSLPRFMFGGNFSGSYKNVDISLAFQGVGKQNVRTTSSMVTPLEGNWGAIPQILDGNYWSSLNSDEQNAAAVYPRLTYVNNETNLTMSDFWMFNGRYFRVKSLTLGYTLPENLTEKMKLNNLRFFVSGNDLFTSSKFPTGWDPERGGSSYPITSSFLFGVNVNF